MKKRLLAAMVAAAVMISSMTAFAAPASKQGTWNYKLCQNQQSKEKGYKGDKDDKDDRKGDKDDKEDKKEQDKFKSNKSITRSELAMLLYQTLKIDIKYVKAPDIQEFFSDVKNSADYADELYALVSLGIVDYKGKFQPNKPVTRQEMAHFMVKAYDYRKQTIPQVNAEADSKTTPKDIDSVSSAYKADVLRAIELGFFRLDNKKLFQPNKGVTNGEAKALMEKLSSVPVAGVDVQAGFEKVTDGVKLKLVIRNTTDKDVLLQHNSGQKYDFVLLDAQGKQVYKWSEGRSFIQMLTETSIPAGKTVEFAEVLNAGTYGDVIAKAAVLKAYITGTSESFNVNPDGYSIKIIDTPVDPGKIDNVKVEASAQREDGNLKLKLVITNPSDKVLTISHSSLQKYDFVLMDANKAEIYRWSADKTFAAVLSTTTVAPKSSVTFEEMLFASQQAVIIGKAKYAKAFITGTSNNFNVNPDGYSIKIIDTPVDPGKIDNVKVEASAQRETGNLKLKLVITNPSDKVLTISHPSSQKYDFVVLDAYKSEIYRWSADKMFTAAISITTVAPKSSVTFEETLSASQQAVIIGKAKYVKAFITGTSTQFDIRTEGYMSEIKQSTSVIPLYEKTADLFRMKLTIANDTASKIVIQHTSTQRYDFALLDANKQILYRWSADKLFAAAAITTEIEAGKTLTFGEDLPLSVYGTIISKTKYVKAYITGTTDSFKLNNDGYMVEVK